MQELDDLLARAYPHFMSDTYLPHRILDPLCRIPRCELEEKAAQLLPVLDRCHISRTYSAILAKVLAFEAFVPTGKRKARIYPTE